MQLLALIFHLSENQSFKGTLMGISIGRVTSVGTVTSTQKIRMRLQGLGAMTFTNSF